MVRRASNKGSCPVMIIGNGSSLFEPAAVQRHGAE